MTWLGMNRCSLFYFTFLTHEFCSGARGQISWLSEGRDSPECRSSATVRPCKLYYAEENIPV
jgi:hypothetical protein